MPSEITPAASPSPEVLAAFGIHDATITRIEAGRANGHWLLDRPDGAPMVLRRYHSRRSMDAIAWEHSALDHAASTGWPVPVPVGRGARRVREIEGVRWSLFPFLRGEPVEPGSTAMARLKGRLLARLHGDFASMPVEGQRPRFGRAWELDQFLVTGGVPAFNEMLRLLERQHREVAQGLRSLKYRNLRELARLGYGELPVRPVHGDFHADNLLFHGGELTGLLDFDSCRLDAPVADIAISISLDCLQKPMYDGIDPAQAVAFVEGYVRHRRLHESDLRLIVPLIRAAWLVGAAFRLDQWAAGDDPERRVASLDRTVKRRVPELDANGLELSARIVALAEGT